MEYPQINTESFSNGNILNNYRKVLVRKRLNNERRKNDRRKNDNWDTELGKKILKDLQETVSNW